MKSILKNSNGNAVSTGGKLFTVSANYTDQIKQALIDKGVATEDTPNSELVSKIEGINTLKDLLDTKKSAEYLFSNFQGENVNGLIKYNDTENVTNMEYMFYSTNNMKEYPELDTRNVKTMKGMFYNSFSANTIPKYETRNVTNMSNMFRQSDFIEIPELDTSKVTDMSNVFESCKRLQTIDITSLDKVTSTSKMASFAKSCHSLTKQIIRTMTVIPPLNTSSFKNCYHFDGTVDVTYNPEGLKDGRIYVPDDMVETLKTATNWSVYADIIVPLSTLVED